MNRGEEMGCRELPYVAKNEERRGEAVITEIIMVTISKHMP